jgi:diacylglycerol kinase family enzyme
MAGQTATAPISSKRCVAIINPAGANGRAQQLWQKLEYDFSTKLSTDGFLLEQTFTWGPGSAARLAAEAVQDGAEVVLVVVEMAQYMRCVFMYPT